MQIQSYVDPPNRAPMGTFLHWSEQSNVVLSALFAVVDWATPGIRNQIPNSRFLPGKNRPPRPLFFTCAPARSFGV